MIMGRAEENRILCIHKPPVNEEWTAYARYISSLLGGQAHIQTLRPQEEQGTRLAGGEVASDKRSQVRVVDKETTAPEPQHPQEYGIWRPSTPDLIIFGEPQFTWWQRLSRRAQANRVVNRAQSTVLIARRPRLPLRRLLWIIRDHETDDATLKWIERLAGKSKATVTLLPIVPAFPRLYQRGAATQFPMSIYEHDAESLLPGYMRWLAGKHIEGAVSRRQGDPLDQIRNEVHSGTYDLIVIAAEPSNRLERLLVGEVIAPLLRWTDRPILIAR